MKSSSLERELYLEIFNRFLAAGHEQTTALAIGIFEAYLNEVSINCELRQRHQRALDCLKIHAPVDAGAQQILEQEGI